MKNTASPSSEENTPKDSTSNPLDAIERRVATAAEQILVKKLPSLLRTSIAFDPSVKLFIRQLSAEEIRSLRAAVQSELETQRKVWAAEQSRLANEERQFLRSQTKARFAALGRLLKKGLVASFHILTLLLLCLTLVLALTIRLPAAIQLIWEPPSVKALETENLQLSTEVSQLRMQPALKDRIFLYHFQDGIWAEVEPGAKPVLARLFNPSEPEGREAWQILLKERK